MTASLQFLDQILDITENLKHVQPKSGAPLNFSIRKATAKEQQLISGKSTFPSRRSSLGVRALSTKDAAKEITEEWIKKCREEKDCEKLFKALEAVNEIYGMNEADSIGSLRARHMRYLSIECSLKETIGKHNNQGSLSQIIEKKTAAATRDFDILIEEKRFESEQLEKNIRLAKDNINVAMQRKKEIENNSFNKENLQTKIEENENLIEQLKDVIASSKSQNKAVKEQHDELQQLNKDLPAETNILRLRAEELSKNLKDFEKKKTLDKDNSPEILELKDQIKNTEEALSKIKGTSEITSKSSLDYKKLALELIEKKMSEPKATVLRILTENDGEMPWDAIKEEMQKQLSSSDSIAILYDLVAHRILTIDRSVVPPIARINMI